MARCLRRRARLGSWCPRRAKPLSSTCRLMVIGTLLIVPAVAVGQSDQDVRAVLRTSWGDPDLQGVWVSNSPTPLERPSALAGRDRLTDEEVATLQARADRIFSNGRSAFATGGIAFGAALENVDTFDHPQSTSNSLGMIDFVFDNRTSMVVDPPDGRIPPLTPDGRRRQAAVAAGWQRKAGPEDFNAIHRCITTGVPRLGGNFGAGPYSYYQILQTPGYVVLVMEAFHDVRIIPPMVVRICRRASDSGTATLAGTGRAILSSSRLATFRPTATSAARLTDCTWSSG